MTKLKGYDKIPLIKGVEEECAVILPQRETAVGASRRVGYRVSSFRAEGKKADRQVEPFRDCCVKVIGIDRFRSGGYFRNLSGTTGIKIMLVSKKYLWGDFFCPVYEVNGYGTNDRFGFKD